MNKIDDVDEETFRDAKSIIELLKENLTLWKEEEGGADNNIEDLWGDKLLFWAQDSIISFISALSFLKVLYNTQLFSLLLILSTLLFFFISK